MTLYELHFDTEFSSLSQARRFALHSSSNQRCLTAPLLLYVRTSLIQSCIGRFQSDNARVAVKPAILHSGVVGPLFCMSSRCCAYLALNRAESYCNINHLPSTAMTTLWLLAITAILSCQSATAASSANMYKLGLLMGTTCLIHSLIVHATCIDVTSPVDGHQVQNAVQLALSKLAASNLLGAGSLLTLNLTLDDGCTTGANVVQAALQMVAANVTARRRIVLSLS